MMHFKIGILRSKVRGAYKIEGTVIEDCFCSYCCPVNYFLLFYLKFLFKIEIFF
jgi:hypothetical protein